MKRNPLSKQKILKCLKLYIYLYVISYAYFGFAGEVDDLIRQAESLRQDKSYDAADEKYVLGLSIDPHNPELLYGYSRLLAQTNQLQKASEYIQKVINVSDSSHTAFPNILNMAGWVHLMLGNVDKSIAFFSESKSPGIYEKLDQSTKMKLHNNSGYAFMISGRYEESLTEFVAAKGLGSKKAALNIEKVRSLIETEKLGNPDISGIFAVVIASSKYEENVSKLIEKANMKFPENQKTLRIFKAGDELFFVTIDSSLSYAKATEVRDFAVSRGVTDAFISSTTTWSLFNPLGSTETAQ